MEEKLQRLKDTIVAYKYWGILLLRCKIGLRKKNLHQKVGNKLLLLTWAFSPTISAGVYRPLSLVKYGQEFGWEVSVISGPAPENIKPAGIHLLKSLPKNAKILRLGQNKISRIIPSYNYFPRVDGGFINALSTISLGQREFADNPPSVVMASGPPFHNFVSAYYLAEFFGSKLVLDYRDEWTECPFDFVSLGNSDLRWERACLKKADCVMFVTKSLLDHHMKVFKELKKEKCIVVPNGWEPEDFGADRGKAEITRIPSSEKKVVISFVGTLGRHTLPGKFLSTLEIVLKRREDLKSHLRIQFIGNKGKSANSELDAFMFADIIEKEEHVPRNVAACMMENTSALLLFYDERFSRTMPGKFYDYLKAGPPIIIVGDRGEAVDLVKDLNAGFIIKENDPDALEETIDRLIRGNYLNTDHTRIDRWLSFHTREKMSQKVFEALDYLL
jgi:glycosyltransferase involved in cell wall biosynthesis